MAESLEAKRHGFMVDTVEVVSVVYVHSFQVFFWNQGALGWGKPKQAVSCVCICVCEVVSIKLYITALSGPVLLVILSYSHSSSGESIKLVTKISDETRQRRCVYACMHGHHL